MSGSSAAVGRVGCAGRGSPRPVPVALDRNVADLAGVNRYVKDGFADHARFRKDGQADLGAYLIHLSSIFKWFREDLERAAKTLPEFVARYAADATASALRAGGVRVDFPHYDWSLKGR